MIIDSHQHFWNYNEKRDTWINESMGVLKKDFLPHDLEPILKQNKIDGCIAVQADQSEEETEFLLKCASKNKFIKVSNTYDCLKKLAILKRNYTNGKIIAVTGSSGKTTVKDLIGNLLKRYGDTYFSPRSLKNFPNL